MYSRKSCWLSQKPKIYLIRCHFLWSSLSWKPRQELIHKAIYRTCSSQNSLLMNTMSVILVACIHGRPPILSCTTGAFQLYLQAAQPLLNDPDRTSDSYRGKIGGSESTGYGWGTACPCWSLSAPQYIEIFCAGKACMGICETGHGITLGYSGLSMEQTLFAQLLLINLFSLDCFCLFCLVTTTHQHQAKAQSFLALPCKQSSQLCTTLTRTSDSFLGR